MKRLARALPLVAAAIFSLALTGQAVGDALVTSGSPSTPFTQNKQNEPAIAVNPANPALMAAGSNDEIDLEACNAGDPTTCPFTAGVGVSGIYLSNGGGTWTQPTYTGWTARHCLGPAACTPHVGPIGTLPRYYERGLASDGDPALAYGPKPGAGGRFAWSNGTRLYYANLTANFSANRSEATFKGFEAIAVSRSDTGGTTWLDPVVVSKQNAALFSDHEAIAVDDAEVTSPFFGSVYVCDAAFRSQEIGGFPEPIVLNSSHDGGNTWRSVQISPAVNNNTIGGRQDCQVDTDSRGNVYVVWDGIDARTRSLALFVAKSTNGGKTFPGPQRVIQLVTGTGIFDGLDLTFDGFAGARDGTAPSLSIANGAPSGLGATDELVVSWEQGPTPSDTSPGANEKAQVIWSTNGGGTWQGPVTASPASDRTDFVAIAISPNGGHVGLVYDNFLQPWQSSILAPPRRMQGVVRTAAVGAGGAVGSFTDRYRGPIGDARGSSANALVDEFLGDYNAIAATNTFVVAAWNDTRAAAECPAVDAFRESLKTESPLPRPAPNSVCPATFGNSDIWSTLVNW
jgi:hypothetical protein